MNSMVLVPTNVATVTIPLGTLTVVAEPTRQLNDVCDDHAVVLHSPPEPTSTVGVYDQRPKLSPEMVTEVCDDVGTFGVAAELIVGAS